MKRDSNIASSVPVHLEDRVSADKRDCKEVDSEVRRKPNKSEISGIQ